MSTLPAIDFAGISATAQAAIQAYGTSVVYKPVGDDVGRTVKAVIYKDQTGDALLQDADSAPAMALLDPTDFASGPPAKFDTISSSTGGFVGTWSLTEDAHPILAADTLPLYIVNLRRN